MKGAIGLGLLALLWPFMGIAFVCFIGTAASRAAKKANNAAQQAWERGFSARADEMMNASGAKDAAHRNAQNPQNAQNAQARYANAGAGENYGTSYGSYGTYTEADGKPVIKHSAQDCTGGSIHTDYHEGTAQRQAASGEGTHLRSSINAGSAGSKSTGGTRKENKGSAEPAKKRSDAGMAAGRAEAGTARAAATPETGAGAYTAASSATSAVSVFASEDNGAERLENSISKLPAAVQGIIWSEVFSRPISER